MKIAFLFLTINDIYFPSIWDYYFKNNHKNISIYCHPKYPEKIKTTWLKKNIITNLVPTKWGYFTNAIINLLKAALQDKENTKFIIISESCIPIKSFKTFYEFLSNDHINTSYIHLRDFDDYNIKKSKIKINNINIKHSGWFCLSRHHVKKLLINDNLSKFNQILAGDEHILSLIYNTTNIKQYEITSVNWEHHQVEINEINQKLKKLYEKKESEHTSNYDDEILSYRIRKSDLGKHPKTYNNLSNEELDEIMNSKSFFMRKFSQFSNIDMYYKDIF